MFQLLHGRLSQPTQRRRKIAEEILATADNLLDHNSLKLKHLCAFDLRHVRASGCMVPGSLLHAILSITALNLEIDSGEVESLNSMIKAAMSLANNSGMSLELLSSRVNSRKTLMMTARKTVGSRVGNTYTELKPVAESLARTSLLYQSFEEQSLADVERWSPPPPVPLTVNKPATYDPSSSLSPAQKWAVKYNKLFMQAVRHHDKKNGDAVVFGMLVEFRTHDSVHVVAEVSGRTCQTLALQAVMVAAEPDVLEDGGIGAVHRIWEVPQDMNFQASLSAIAACFDDAKVCGKDAITVRLVQLHVFKSASVPVPQLRFRLGAKYFVAQLHFRKPYERRVQPAQGQPASESQALLDDTISTVSRLLATLSGLHELCFCVYDVYVVVYCVHVL